VLHDEPPNVRTDELNVNFPSPEYMFMATSEADFKTASNLHMDIPMASCTVSLTLSSLFSDVDQPELLPNTLMGRFVLLTGT
jgi:hypothetical protein